MTITINRSIASASANVLKLDTPVSIPTAARIIGLPAWKVRKAVQLKLVPVYYFTNSRRLVKPAELLAVIASSRVGGDQ